MAQGLEHERMRFSTMTVNQLHTRLNKITTEEKLRNFILTAWEYRHWDLMTAAEKRMENLFGLKPSLRPERVRTNIPPPPPRPQAPPPKQEAPPKEYRRAIEF